MCKKINKINKKIHLFRQNKWFKINGVNIHYSVFS